MILRSGLEGTTQRREGGSGLVGEVGGVDLSLEGLRPECRGNWEGMGHV